MKSKAMWHSVILMTKGEIGIGLWEHSANWNVILSDYYRIHDQFISFRPGQAGDANRGEPVRDR